MRRDGRSVHDRGEFPAFSVAMLVMALIAMMCTGCAHKPPPPIVPPGGATCASACARGEVLGCEWSKPTPNGVPCVDVCESLERSGSVTYGVQCVTMIDECDAANQCGGPVVP